MNNKTNFTAKENSNIVFQQDGTPFSQQFDDIYFDTQVGYRQSEDVFIDGNNIVNRLEENKQSIVIGETGFGTGLNFFITLKHFQNARSKHGNAIQKLTYISVEKYPLNSAQIKKALSIWPDFTPYAEDFARQYDKRDETDKIIELSFFDGLVSLVLIFEDASSGFDKLSTVKKEAYKTRKMLLPAINAWYLDGFSPAKNPEMWSDQLFSQLARLSDDDATLATFTVAGFVKRGLKNVGFRLTLKESEGRKNKSLAGKYQQHKTSGKGYMLRPSSIKQTRVAIIGSGIAAATLAYKLTKQNIWVTIYCQDEQLAQGGSSNAIGAVYPLLHQDRDDISDFYHEAFTTALDFYKSLTAEGVDYPHQWCGVLDLAFKPALKQRLNKFDELKAWPSSIIHTVDAKQASEISNLPLEHGGLFMPQAGWVAPQELVRAIFDKVEKTGLLKIKTRCDIDDLSQRENGTWVLSYGKKKDNVTSVVMCGGAQTPLVAPFNQLPLYPVRGQVSSMKTNNDIKKLSTVVCHKGYLTPENQGIHCIGATFDKDDSDTIPRAQDDDYNLAMYHKSLASFPKWQTEDIVNSKARLRCMSPDHVPIAGPMPKTSEYYELYKHLEKDKNWKIDTPAPYYENLYVLSGLGARGLCSAPLLADIVVADMCGTPYPVNNKMRFNLAPNRFIIKDIIKRKFHAEQ